MAYVKTNWVDNTTPINETNLNKIESGIKNNDINIGEENYDNTKTYEVGDIVRYNEKIYKCITAITTAENFDSSKWEQTNIVEIVQSEKSKIYELIEAISTPIVGEGENITLNDTAEKRFEKFDIEGNSEQEASPSPDYPSEVKSCGDNINLFDKNDITNNTSIDVRNGNTYTDNNSFSTNFIKINGITELCCNGLSDTSKLWGAIYDENKSFIKGINTTNGIFNETNLSGATYIRLGLLKTYLDTMKLEKGKVATPYSTYGQGCINEVICNKNIFDKNNPQYLDGYGLDVTGFFARGDQRTYIIPVPQNKENITVSYTKILTGSRYYAFADEIPIDKSSSHYERIMFANSSDTGKITFTAKNNNYKYLLIGSTTSEVFTDLQVEQNPTATPYEEHKEQTYTIPVQQPMRSVGDTRDTFILKENGKWYERHNIARKIFDGTESFEDSLSNNKRYYFMYNTLNPLPKAISNNGITPEILSNKLTKVSVNNLISSNKQGIAYNTEGKVYIYTETTSTMNNAQFRTWLSEQYNAGTPLYVYYILKTPLDIECTSEQTEILNQMYIKAKSYKGVTHIHSNDEVSPNCYVEAVKDLTTLIQ